MKVKVSELRKIVREALKELTAEGRPWGRAIGAEWDEGPEGDRYDRAEYYRKKAKERAAKKAAALASLKKPSAEPEKKNELDEREDNWVEDVLTKVKNVALTDIGGPKGFLTPAGDAARNGKPTKGDPRKKNPHKKGISETGSYYGKTAPAQGAILGGNGQKDPGLTSACGDPACPGCDEDGPVYLEDPPPMCWCGDRDCSHYE